jgi:hypothetical protein
LVLVRLEVKNTSYSIVSIRGWHDAGGILACPACGHGFPKLKKREYDEIRKIESGPEYVKALNEIEAAVKQQFGD